VRIYSGGDSNATSGAADALLQNETAIISVGKLRHRNQVYQFVIAVWSAKSKRLLHAVALQRAVTGIMTSRDVIRLFRQLARDTRETDRYILVDEHGVVHEFTGTHQREFYLASIALIEANHAHDRKAQRDALTRLLALSY
jgi:hypothetical protein